MRLIDADALRQVLEVFTEKDTLGHTPLQLCNAMPTVNQWRRVEEPPKDSKPVICWEKQEFPYVDRYFPKYGWEFANNALAEPIYWMPIEPPKEVQE